MKISLLERGRQVVLDPIKTCQVVEQKLNNLKMRVRTRREADLLEAIRFTRSMNDVRRVIESDTSISKRFQEYVLPVEQVLFKRITADPVNPLPRNVPHVRLIENVEEIPVIGCDTSEIRPSAHYLPLFMLINVGVFAMGAEEGEYFSESDPHFYTWEELTALHPRRLRTTLRIDSRRIEAQCETILSVVDRIRESGNSKSIIVLLDETLSLGYLVGRSAETREETVTALLEMMGELKKKNCIPVGVFYTMSTALTVSLIRGVMCRNKPSCSVCIEGARSGGNIKDLPCEKYMMRDVKLVDLLLDPGCRTFCFEVKNVITRAFSYTVLAFYLKVWKNDVLRVEIPQWASDKVNEIASVVYLQSIMGAGYPYVLERAHEYAVIRSGERDWFISMISRVLRDILHIDLRMSRKEIMKKMLGGGVV